uniref:Probable peroxygenase 4 n=1 Tax=Cicer arietinum TaxID=3827 RepID=A0A3Q7XVA8_CICAR|nr:probable peroxygenase 4 [Cicer arietinum]
MTLNAMNSFQVSLPLLISFFYVCYQIAITNADNLSVLQKHVSFFDSNHDGIIYPKETYQGLRAIGCGVVLSMAASAFIHSGFSRKTRPVY